MNRKNVAWGLTGLTQNNENCYTFGKRDGKRKLNLFCVFEFAGHDFGKCDETCLFRFAFHSILICSLYRGFDGLCRHSYLSDYFNRARCFLCPVRRAGSWQRKAWEPPGSAGTCAQKKFLPSKDERNRTAALHWTASRKLAVLSSLCMVEPLCCVIIRHSSCLRTLR